MEEGHALTKEVAELWENIAGKCSDLSKKYDLPLEELMECL